MSFFISGVDGANGTSTASQSSSADGSTSDQNIEQLLLDCLNDVMGGQQPKLLRRSESEGSPTSSDDSQPTSNGTQPTATNSAQPTATNSAQPTATNSAQPTSSDSTQPSASGYYPAISGADGNDIKSDPAINELMKKNPDAASAFMSCFEKGNGGGDAAAKKLTDLVNSGSVDPQLASKLALDINPLAKANGFGDVQNHDIQADLAKATGGTDYLHMSGSPLEGCGL